MSLRRRVVLGCLAVALVLFTADVVLAGTFRQFLLGRVDEQLDDTAGRIAAFATGTQEPARGPGGRPGGRGGPRLRPAPGPGGGGPALSEFFVAIADATGTVTRRVDTPLRADLAAPLLTPAAVRANATAPGDRVAPFTVGSDGGPPWRVAAVRPVGADLIVVVGSSLAQIAPTYGRMNAVLVLATVAVLLTLVAVAWWVLRQGVRPLAAMTASAEAIAGDALHERVTVTDQRTEAGRLGVALNTMLERLQAAFAQRRASEEQLRRFVADASHELRTPLTSIRGYTELYRTGALAEPDALDDAMRRVEQEAVRMGLLVDDLLLLAKLDQGRPLAAEPVDLGAVVEDAVTDLRAVDPARPVTVRIEPVTVVGDEPSLRQAVGNLLANARAHTPAGTAVHISVSSEDSDAVIAVADEGPGIAPSAAERVFERFYRADPSRQRPGAAGGSGLGLAIVVSIAQAHGGSVALDTAVGQGARFVVRLPRQGAADES
jgi:two-component system OmpR family sensor kinase